MQAPSLAADAHQSASHDAHQQGRSVTVDAAHAPNPDYYEEDEGDEADPEQDREPPFVVDDGKIFSLIERGDPAVLGGVRTAAVMLRRRQ
ncbi:MAG: hypothetical protein IPI49_19275 [Myxococcales bacterium]|nr:hypothetical protein [Myxococcales bacterium]